MSIRVEVGCPCVDYDNCVTTDGFHIPGRSCEHGHLRGQTAVPVPCVVLQRQIVERPQRRLAPIVSLVRRHHPFTRGCIQAEAADEQRLQTSRAGSGPLEAHSLPVWDGARTLPCCARAWIVASRAWIVNRPCARLNLTEVASGLAIRSSRIVHVHELVPGDTRGEKLFEDVYLSRPFAAKLYFHFGLEFVLDESASSRCPWRGPRGPRW